MSHLLYLMFRCDFDMMESLKSLEEFGGSEHTPCFSLVDLLIRAGSRIFDLAGCRGMHSKKHTQGARENSQLASIGKQQPKEHVGAGPFAC